MRIPRPGHGTGSAYQKLERRAGDFATVGVAAVVRIGADGRVADAGIGLTAVAATPFAATDAEAALIGTDGGDAAIAAASAAAAAQSSPADDSHGPATYKRAMVVEMTGRALRLALARARGQA